MKAKFAIVSLRFNPAFVQHAIAFAKLVREAGHEPTFILDSKYQSFPELMIAAPVLGIESTKSQNSWTHAIFLNPSVENKKLAIALNASGAKLYYILHEPWQPTWSFIKAEGVWQSIKTMSAYHLTVPILKLSDKVLFASRYGLEVYKKYNKKYNFDCSYFPLVYDDRYVKDAPPPLSGKRYFGYLGSLSRAHGFDHYVSFMRFAFQRDLDVHFLIASRNPLPDDILRDPYLSRNLDKIKICCGRVLSSDEMDQYYAECFCIWMLYRKCTQSGVLPKALMSGTPVVAASIGSIPEYIREGANGRFSEALDHEKTWDALQEISNARRAYFENCRQTFLQEFFYRAALPMFEQLL